MKALPDRLYPLAVALASTALAAAVILGGASRIALEQGRNDLALRLWGERSIAAAALAEEAQRSGRQDVAVRLARTALQLSLAYPEPIRVLGLNAAARGDMQSAAQLMSSAARWGWRDTETHMWLLRQSLLAEDFPRAMQHIDALIRRQEAREKMFELITKASELFPGAMKAIVPHFEARPKWRPVYFEPSENPSISEPGFEKLVREMRRSAAPATREEMKGVIGQLLQQGEYDRAAGLWSDLFPGDLVSLKNRAEAELTWPQPELAKLALPFGWRLRETGDRSVEFARSSNGTGELLIAPFGQVLIEPIVSRTILLPPGRYDIFSKAPASEMPISWTMRCLPSGQSIDASPTGAPAIWRVDVPVGCRASELTLVPSPAFPRDRSIRIPSFRIRRIT